MPLGFFVVVLGACLGSFITTTALRIEKGQSLLLPSACDHCQGRISPWGLLPVLGYFLSQSRCRHCQAAISPLYPVTELLQAGLAGLVFSKTGWQVAFFKDLLLFEAFFLIALLDFRTYLIFSAPLLFILGLQLFWTAFFEQEFVLERLVGCLAGAGAFHWIAWLYEVIRKRPGLGQGDASLLGAWGLFLGWEALIPLVFWAAILGLFAGLGAWAFKKQGLDQKIAFGPWLCLAGFWVWRWPEWAMIWPWFQA